MKIVLKPRKPFREVVVRGIKRVPVEDIARCAFFMTGRQFLLWKDGYVFCCILDEKYVRSPWRFLRRGKLVIDELCYDRMPNYRSGITLYNGSLSVAMTIVKALHDSPITSAILKVIKAHEEGRVRGRE